MDGSAEIPVAPERRAGEILEWAGALVTPSLRTAVERLPDRIRHLAGCHFGWRDMDGTPQAGPQGKGLRPALALLSCQAVGGEPSAALPAAVAVELVHNASLLHDDIIDGDHMRRGRPALWASFGVPAGILAGDALFFLAVQVLLEAPPPLGGAGVGQLTGAVQELIDGEYTDTVLEDRPTVLVAECEAMASAKTGALFAAACGLGALAAGAAADRRDHLRAFGTHLGMAFQLVDDVLGIWGDGQYTGKPARSDLAARKKTLPVTAALATDGAPGRELAHLYCRDTPLSPAEVERAARLVDEAGGRSWALTEAQRHTTRALGHLTAVRPVPQGAADLAALAQVITCRDR
ncbi:polyprenyl synthetase family protein [Streptomyces morookaense]|uniref:Polyprenyl synthetase family protein n=1 Tax=Streptomyces morookaense TaxID=1970 RepID=A0A7Y7B754_STRMO|nr:polyprenyl synthetase family protein [Streptomyces morookaense]NVK80270.1 polyprenyl synthetase family protein [Streptomyces morookaense]GHF40097.1 dimethylallyltransferase [Streptomyces morookaense]